MPKNKLTDYSATNASNTDVGGINIDEGMQPSSVNDAIREVMTHLKDFSDGTSGVDVLNLQDDDASASIKIQAPATVTATTTFTLPDGDGSSGQVLQTNGTGTLSWTSNGLANVVEDTTPQLGGNLDTNGNDISFGDNDKAIFGAGSDLQIYHDGSDSYIQDVGIGNLFIQGESAVYIRDNAGAAMAVFNDGGAVQLRYNGIEKLATTSGGIDVTGTVTADEFVADSAGSLGNDQIMMDFSAPAGRLRVKNSSGSPAANMDFYTTDTGGNTRIRQRVDYAGDISFYDSTGVTQGLFWDASTQRLGLGTTSPNKTLTVATPQTANTVMEVLRLTGSGTYDAGGSNEAGAGISFGQYSGTYPDWNLGQISGVRSGASWDGALTFSTNDGSSQTSITEAMRIDSSGNVGIGTSSPVRQMHINAPSGANTYLHLTNATTGATTTDGFSLVVSTSDGEAIIAQREAQALSFWTSNTEAARIDSSGNLLVGTTASGFDTGADNFVVGSGAENAGMTIYSGTTNTGTINFADGTSGSAIYAGGINYNHSTNTMAFYTTDGSGRMRIDSSGNLLVGTTSVTPNPGVTFQPAGNVTCGNSAAASGFEFATFRRSAVQIGSITQSGTTGVAYNTSSDYRLKENVTADWDATTRLKQLNPVRFNFIADPDTTVDGFLAHEVQDIVPEAISGTKDAVDADGNPVYQGIDQSKLVPLLVKTIQELEARIAALEAN